MLCFFVFCFFVFLFFSVFVFSSPQILMYDIRCIYNKWPTGIRHFPFFLPFEFGPMTIRPATPCTVPYHEFKRKTLEFFSSKFLINLPFFFLYIFKLQTRYSFFFGWDTRLLLWFLKLDILITFFFSHLCVQSSKFKVQTIIFVPLKKKKKKNLFFFMCLNFKLAKQQNNSRLIRWG